jgi:serpin B
MEQQAGFRLSRTLDRDVIELPYRAAGFSMFITLPAAGSFLEVERTMSSRDLLREAESTMQPKEVLLQLPRFRVTVSLELDPILMRLGVRRVFSSGADFDGLTPGGREALVLTTLRHGVVVDVTEERTEAAAATGAGIGIVSAIPEVRVDRPFLFAIVHRPTWTVLFSGRVMDPSE